jgi:hypothetical protein
MPSVQIEERLYSQGIDDDLVATVDNQMRVIEERQRNSASAAITDMPISA